MEEELDAGVTDFVAGRASKAARRTRQRKQRAVVNKSLIHHPNPSSKRPELLRSIRTRSCYILVSKQYYVLEVNIIVLKMAEVASQLAPEAYAENEHENEEEENVVSSRTRSTCTRSRIQFSIIAINKEEGKDG